MGATKSYEFTLKENKLAKYAKALAHPARIAILKLLAKRQVASVETLWMNCRFRKARYRSI